MQKQVIPVEQTIIDRSEICNQIADRTACISQQDEAALIYVTGAYFNKVFNTCPTVKAPMYWSDYVQNTRGTDQNLFVFHSNIDNSTVESECGYCNIDDSLSQSSSLLTEANENFCYRESNDTTDEKAWGEYWGCQNETDFFTNPYNSASTGICRHNLNEDKSPKNQYAGCAGLLKDSCNHNSDCVWLSSDTITHDGTPNCKCTNYKSYTGDDGTKYIMKCWIHDMHDLGPSQLLREDGSQYPMAQKIYTDPSTPSLVMEQILTCLKNAYILGPTNS